MAKLCRPPLLGLHKNQDIPRVHLFPYGVCRAPSFVDTLVGKIESKERVFWAVVFDIQLGQAIWQPDTPAGSADHDEIEIRRLKAELGRVTEERDILKKATAH